MKTYTLPLDAIVCFEEKNYIFEHVEKTFRFVEVEIAKNMQKHTEIINNTIFQCDNIANISICRLLISSNNKLRR